MDDEDIPMTGGSSGSQGNFHPIGNNRRRGGNRVHSPAPRGGGHAGNTGKTRKLLEGPTSWYKVTVSCAIDENFRKFEFIFYIHIFLIINIRRGVSLLCY